MIRFVHIPEKKAYYRAQEDCCYEIASYDKDNIGITSLMDDEVRGLNSWDLLCNCDPRLEMIDITEEDFIKAKQDICKKMENLGLKDKDC